MGRENKEIPLIVGQEREGVERTRETPSLSDRKERNGRENKGELPPPQTGKREGVERTGKFPPSPQTAKREGVERTRESSLLLRKERSSKEEGDRHRGAHFMGSPGGRTARM